jgi:hypothetical protein
MFNLFKNKNTKPEIVADEWFKKLLYFSETPDEASHLLGSRIFQPLKCEVEYQIFSDNKKISQAQRQFLLEIENRYLELKHEMELFINAEIEKVSTVRKTYKLEQDLALSLIVIPKDVSTIKEWSLEYAVNNDFSFFAVEFQDWKPFWFSISA